MKILVVSAMDATNLSIANVLKEFIRRGHFIEVYAQFTDHKSVRMFKELAIPFHHARELTKEIISQFDIAFCGVDAMNILRFADIYVFAYNFIFNGWASEGADFMFTLSKDRSNMRYLEDCATMPVGVPKNDTLNTSESKKQFLYIDAGHIPFGKKGKEEVGQMLLNVCKAYPDYKLVIKPRWLLSDTVNFTHRNSDHIYMILDELTNGELPENLVLLNEHKDLQTLIDESESVITTSISCYLDVALRGKGVIVVGGLDSEDKWDIRTNVSLKREYSLADDAGCLVDFQKVTEYLPQGIRCREEHIERLIPYRVGASSHIVDVVEYVYENFLKYYKYPAIRNYSYETYKSDLHSDPQLDLITLKYKRIKNAIIGRSRYFDFVDADIDYNSYYETLEYAYKNCSLEENSFAELAKKMYEKNADLLIRERNILMDEPINQSFLLQALYSAKQYADILDFPQDRILCMGAYHYYLAMIFFNEKFYEKSLEHFYQYLEEADRRSFAKYQCEDIAGIRECYHRITVMCDGKNIPPEKFAAIYDGIHKRKIETKMPYNERKKLYQYALSYSRQLFELGNYELAAQCAIRCIEQRNVFNEEKKKVVVLQQENTRLMSSLSYKIGLAVTLLPRKARAGLKCIKEHGMAGAVQTATANIASIFRNKLAHLYKIWDIFHFKVITGYKLYARIMEQYGRNAQILLSAPATGDAYIYGMLFHAYVRKKYPNKKPIFVVYGEASISAARLFQIENIEACNTEEFHALYNLLMFLSPADLFLESLHYHVFYRHTCMLTYLEGLHDFNFFSGPAAYLELESKEEYTVPVFRYDEESLLQLFDQINCTPGKTIVLAPYAKSVKRLPMLFWKYLADQLTACGYDVCTNSVGESEPPVYGTQAVFVSYDKSVPFIEEAGAVIGVRSGFLDVVSSAKCLKISICSEDNYKRSPITHISNIYNLEATYGQPGQYDLIYAPESMEELIDEIVNLVKTELIIA